MAAAIKVVDARARSLELAAARGYWSACSPGRSMQITFDGMGQVITYTLCIPSASHADVWHVVTYNAHQDDTCCEGQQCSTAACAGIAALVCAAAATSPG